MKKLVLSLIVCLGLVSSSSYAGCAGLSGCLKEAGKIVSNESKTLGGQLSNGWKSAGLVVSEQYKHAANHVIEKWHATYKNWVTDDELRWILNSTAELAALYPLASGPIWTSLLIRKITIFNNLRSAGYFDDAEIMIVGENLSRAEDLQTEIEIELGSDSDEVSEFESDKERAQEKYEECYADAQSAKEKILCRQTLNDETEGSALDLLD